VTLRELSILSEKRKLSWVRNSLKVFRAANDNFLNIKCSYESGVAYPVVVPKLSDFTIDDLTY
jgi:hypothetical protein